jgi:hypothetical protein
MNNISGEGQDERNKFSDQFSHDQVELKGRQAPFY